MMSDVLPLQLLLATFAGWLNRHQAWTARGLVTHYVLFAINISTRDSGIPCSCQARGPHGANEGESIGQVMAWLGRQEMNPAGPPRVLYLHNPAMTVPEDQVSEVQIPVAE